MKLKVNKQERPKRHPNRLDFKPCQLFHGPKSTCKGLVRPALGIEAAVELLVELLPALGGGGHLAFHPLKAS